MSKNQQTFVKPPNFLPVLFKRRKCSPVTVGGLLCLRPCCGYSVHVVAGVPAVAGFPAVAGVPAVAGFPAVAGVPAVAGFPAVASVPGVDSLVDTTGQKIRRYCWDR